MSRIDILKGFLEENPNDSFSRYAIALEYVKLGKNDDAVREFETVNKVPARGGAIDGPGATVVDGMVYVNSGYAFTGGMSGNVLLAFSVDGK